MPTTNPVPSTDPSDLLFNAGKLDEVVNGAANNFTDRLGAARRTVAGMNADFDAQLADAESDLNVYRADAAASAAEALGYLQTIRATSYGAYASDPATDPLGNPPTVGDEYFNTTSNLLKRWNGTTWQASDINTANLAAPSGSSLVGYLPAGSGAIATTVQEELNRSPVNVKQFGANVGGGGDDSSALSKAIDHVSTTGELLVVDCDLNLATWAAKALTASLYITGSKVGRIVGNGANLFSLGDGVGVFLSDISIQGAGTALALSGTGDHPFIKLENVSYSSSGPVLNSGADEIQTIKVVNCSFATISGVAVFKTTSYIKHALFSGNTFRSITSATSELEVIRLGKTQYADQPLTGNYIISDNLFETMVANGNAAGEVHAIILYGDRATITGNIIKDIDRPLARQSGGVEGIYTKVRSVTITGNVLVNAGFAEGNKGGQINVKGDIFGGSADPVGANSTVTGNVVYSTDAQPRNGIRVEGDNTTIVGNTLVGINGTHAIGLAWVYANSRNALIANNSICKPNTTSAQIWINAVGDNIVIDGNVIEANIAGGAYNGIAYTDVNRTSGSVDKFRITNNVIDATGIDYGIIVIATARTMTNLVINENHIKGGTYGIRAISTTYITSGEVRRNYFNGTTLTYRDKSTLTLRYSDNFKDAVPQDTWAAAPTVGTWAVGDIAHASAPATLGFIGWVCTAAGTPGTWKTYGAVTP